MQIVIDVPFPTSTNRIWRLGVRRLFTSPEYEGWKREAHGMYWQQYARKRPQRLARFHISIVLDDRKRPRSDGDNRIKAVLDFCQSAGLVTNDRNCDGGSWVWGEAPSGCRITLTGEPHHGEAIQHNGSRVRVEQGSGALSGG